MSCILYYGPGARQAAMNEALSVGRLVAPPFGEERGLKVDEAREMVSLLNSTPVGIEVGVIIAGPFDQATPEASDALLKGIEEFDETVVRPILWADDVGGVAPTIRSRCLERWVATLEGEEDEKLISAGWDLAKAALSGEVWSIPGTVQEFKGREVELLGAVADALSAERPMPEENVRVWERVRQATVARNPGAYETVACLLPEPT